MPETSFVSALLSVFLVGLLGGVHCAGMCGGVVSALAPRPAAAAPFPVRVVTRQATPLAVLLGYNAGRIASYAMAGGLVGAAGSLAWVLGRLLPIQQFAFVAANLTLIAMGLYLVGSMRVTAIIESAGSHTLGRVWQRLQPAAARALGRQVPSNAFAAGLLWGWMPCGMVYTVLLAALASGSPAQGAALMVAFGLGTLPNLVGLGWLAGRARARLDNRPMKLAAGVIIAAFGVAGLARLDPVSELHSLAQLCLSQLSAPIR